MTTYFPASNEETDTLSGFRETPFNFQSITTFEVRIDERFPEHGYSKNTSDLVMRIMKGRSVTLFVYGRESINFSKGWTFEIPKNTPYYIIAEPSAILYVVSNQRIESIQQGIVTF